MHLDHYRVKRFILTNGWWACPLVAAGVVAVWFANVLHIDWRIFLTIVGALLSAALVLQKQNLDELRLFHELFNEFNARYNGLNDKLRHVLETERVDEKGHQSIIGYFNLCAEEYWWFRTGHIPHEVWRAWCRGMLYYLENPLIKKLWDAEVTQDSYYGLTLDRIRAGAA